MKREFVFPACFNISEKRYRYTRTSEPADIRDRTGFVHSPKLSFTDPETRIELVVSADHFPLKSVIGEIGLGGSRKTKLKALALMKKLYCGDCQFWGQCPVLLKAFQQITGKGYGAHTTSVQTSMVFSKEQLGLERRSLEKYLPLELNKPTKDKSKREKSRKARRQKMAKGILFQRKKPVTDRRGRVDLRRFQGSGQPCRR